MPTEKERIATACVCCGSSDLNKSPAVLMPFVAHRVFGWQPVQIDATWGLKTIQPGMAYSLCNSVYCQDCEFLFLDIRFSDAEMASLYDDYRGHAYTQLREKYEPGYKLRNDELVAGASYLAHVEEFLAPHLNFPLNILDWGGDTGKNSPFRNNKNTLHIYDINNKQPVSGAKMINKDQLSETNYNLIVCSNVLEHIPYPQEILQEIKNAMNQDTVLYIEVPYEAIQRESKDQKFLNLKKRYWHEHINFFSEKSLRCLLEKCDLSILGVNHLKAPHHNGNTSHYLQIACAVAPAI